MSKPNRVSFILIASLAFVMMLMPSAIIAGKSLASGINTRSIATIEILNPALAPQKGPEVVAGAPLKGCDVKLGKPPGGSPAARTTTDAKGKFNFGLMPKGSYYLTLDLPESKNTGSLAETTSRTDPASADVKAVLITIDGAPGGQIKRGWDPKNKKPIELGPQSTAKAAGEEKIILESDGRTPLTGTVQTAVVKSKSNISNN